MVKPCKPEARKAKLPNHTCNTKTGRWNKVPVKTINKSQEDEIKELKKALKKASKDYDALAKRNATNVLRFALVRMMLRQSKARDISLSPMMFSPTMSVLSPIAMSSAASSRLTTPASVTKANPKSLRTSPSLASLLNKAIASPSFGKKASPKKLFATPQKEIVLKKKPLNTERLLKKSDLMTAMAFADCNYRLDKEMFNDSMSSIGDMSGMSVLLDGSVLQNTFASPIADKTASPEQILSLMKDMNSGYVVDSPFVMTDETIDEVLQGHIFDML